MLTPDRIDAWQHEAEPVHRDVARHRSELLSRSLCSLLGLVLLYAILVRGVSELGAVAMCLALAAVYLRWPLHTVVLITPGLIPAMNIDYGIGVTPLPAVVAAAFAGFLVQTRSNKYGWSFRSIPRLVLWGWACILVAILCSSIINERSLWPDGVSWLVRCLLMLLYCSACSTSRILDYALMGWVIAGILSFSAATLVLATTGSALACYGNALPEGGQGDFMAVAHVITGGAFFVSISMWSLLALKTVRVIPRMMAFVGVVLAGLPLIMTGRRQGLIGLLLSVVIYAIGTPRRAALPVLIVFGMSFVLLLASGLLQEVIEGRPSIQYELESHGSRRMGLYEAGISAFLERPIFGWGLESFRDLSEKAGVCKEGQVAHNAFIRLAAEAGMLGLAGVILLFGAVLMASISLAKLSIAGPIGPWAYIFPLLGFVITGAVVSDLFHYLPYLLAMSLLCGASMRFSSTKSVQFPNL